jgi:hypothetical protein
MVVEPEQTFDGEILRPRLETEKRVSHNPDANDGETSESLTVDMQENLFLCAENVKLMSCTPCWHHRLFRQVPERV